MNKDKIVTFVIGFLIGAILSTGGFLIYNKVTVNNKNANRPEMMQGNGNMEKPEDGNFMGENGQSRPADNGKMENNTRNKVTE